jgi:hypothetical protein
VKLCALFEPCADHLWGGQESYRQFWAVRSWRRRASSSACSIVVQPSGPVLAAENQSLQAELGVGAAGAVAGPEALVDLSPGPVNHRRAPRVAASPGRLLPPASGAPRVPCVCVRRGAEPLPGGGQRVGDPLRLGAVGLGGRGVLSVAANAAAGSSWPIRTRRTTRLRSVVTISARFPVAQIAAGRERRAGDLVVNGKPISRVPPRPTKGHA